MDIIQFLLTALVAMIIGTEQKVRKTLLVSYIGLLLFLIL